MEQKRKNIPVSKDEEIFRYTRDKSKAFPDYFDNSENAEIGGDYVEQNGNKTKDINDSAWTEVQLVKYNYDQMAILRDGHKRVGVARWAGALVPPTAGSLKKGVDYVKYIIGRHNFCFNCHRLYINEYVDKNPFCSYCEAIISKNKEYTNDLIDKTLYALEKIPGAFTYEKESEALRTPLIKIIEADERESRTINKLVKIVDKKNMTVNYDIPVVSVINYLKRLKLIRLHIWKDFYEQIGAFGRFYQYRRITGGNNSYILKLPSELKDYYSFMGYHKQSNKNILILSQDSSLPELSTLTEIQPIKIGRRTQIGNKISVSQRSLLYNDFRRAEAGLFFQGKKFNVIVPQIRSFIFPKTEKELHDLDKSVNELNKIALSRPSKKSMKAWDNDDLYENM